MPCSHRPRQCSGRANARISPPVPAACIARNCRLECEPGSFRQFRRRRIKMKNTFAGCALLCVMTAHAQAAEAPTREALEKMFVMLEGEWAAQECTHKIVETDLLWDDFMGTDTKGGRYTKQQSIDKSKADSTRARDCRLLETPQVHFYSDDVAVVFGSE